MDNQVVSMSLTFSSQPDEEYLQQLIDRMLQTIGDRRLVLNVYVGS